MRFDGARMIRIRSPRPLGFCMVCQTPVHAQQRVEMLLGFVQQRPVLRACPTLGLDAADLVASEFRRQSMRQVLVKQDAHG